MSKEIAPASEPAKERQTSRKRLRQAEPKPDSAAVPIEYAFVISQTSGMFVIGWAADREAPLQRISVQIEDGSRREWPGAQLIRFRRTDAEKALGLGPTRGLGFCGLLFGDARRMGAARSH